jgi:membrane-associated protease RseP (regulator of RpoE activity)
MKTILFYSILLISGTFCLSAAKAQEKEKSVVIELNDGKILKFNSNLPDSQNFKINPLDIKSITVIGGKGFFNGDYGNPFKGKIVIKGDSIVVSGNPLSFLQNFANGAFLGVQTKPNEKGAEVVYVVSGSPADKAGLQVGDIITGVGKKGVKDPASLASIINSMKPEEIAQVHLLRKGSEKVLYATLAAPNSEFVFSDSIPTLRDFPYQNRMPNFYYRRFRNLPDGEWPFDFRRNLPDMPRAFTDSFSFRPGVALGIQIQDTRDDNGVTVLKVTPKSPAEAAGVKEGDLITAINGNKVSAVRDAKREIRQTRGDEYKMQIQRNNKPVTLTIKIPKKLEKADL